MRTVINDESSQSGRCLQGEPTSSFPPILAISRILPPPRPCWSHPRWIYRIASRTAILGVGGGGGLFSTPVLSCDRTTQSITTGLLSLYTGSLREIWVHLVAWWENAEVIAVAWYQKALPLAMPFCHLRDIAENAICEHAIGVLPVTGWWPKGLSNAWSSTGASFTVQRWHRRRRGLALYSAYTCVGARTLRTKKGKTK